MPLEEQTGQDRNGGTEEMLILGSRIGVRHLRLDDISRFEAWWQDAEANFMDGGDKSGPPATLGERLRGEVKESGSVPSWYMITTHEGEVIGYLRHRSIDKIAARAEIAIRLGREHWGHGYAVEATRLFCRFMRAEFSIKHFWLTVLPSNARARRAYEKCGFVYTGERRIEDDMEWLVMAFDLRESREGKP